MLIEVAGFKMLVGCEWTVVGSHKEALRVKRGAPKKHVLLYKADGSYWVGIHSDTPSKQNYYAAACLVGLVRQTCLIYHQVSDDLVWLGLVVQGVPVVDHDLLVPKAEAYSILDAWKTEVIQAPLIGSSVDSLESLEDCLLALKDMLAGHQISKSALKKCLLTYNAIQWLRLTALVGVCLLPIAGWQIYQHISIRRVPTVPPTIEVSTQEEARKREEERQRRIAEFKNQVVQQKHELAQRIVPSSMWSAVNAIRQELPLSVRGYKPMKIECSTNTCTVQWSSLSSNRIHYRDRAAIPHVVPDLNPVTTATAKYSITPKRSALPPYRGDTAERLWYELMDELKPFSPSIQRPQAIQVSPPGDLGLSPETIGWKGTFSIQVPLMSLRTVLAILDGWPISVNSISLAVNTGASGVSVRPTGMGTGMGGNLLEIRGEYGTVQP
jgi:hypothetical protein